MADERDYQELLSRLTEQERRRLWENTPAPPEYEWISRRVLYEMHRYYRHYSIAEILDTTFSLEGYRWHIVDYDRERDWFKIECRGEVKRPARPKPSDAPSLGGRSGLSGREPMISRKDAE